MWYVVEGVNRGVLTLQDPGCTAVDQQDGTVPVTVVGLPINTNVLTSYTITYTACDSRSPPNCASATRTVQIVETTVPIITMLGSATVRLYVCGGVTDTRVGVRGSTSSLCRRRRDCPRLGTVA